MEGDTFPASAARPLAASETWDEEGAVAEDTTEPRIRKIRDVDPLLVETSKDPFAALLLEPSMGLGIR